MAETGIVNLSLKIEDIQEFIDKDGRDGFGCYDRSFERYD